MIRKGEYELFIFLRLIYYTFYSLINIIKGIIFMILNYLFEIPLILLKILIIIIIYIYCIFRLSILNIHIKIFDIILYCCIIIVIILLNMFFLFSD